MEGALKMIALKGGPSALGLDGLLKHLLYKLMSKGIKEVDIQVEVPWDIQPALGQIQLSLK